jgi:hypothetical protein
MENAACSATENDGDEMQIVLAALSLALLMWVEAASAQSTYSMSVSRHSSVPSLSEAEVREILASASKMLQDDPGSPNDVKCDVTFVLEGPIRTFRDLPKMRRPNTLASVDKKNIAAVNKVDSDVHGVDFHVKVVEEIKFCRPGVHGNQAGCAFSPPDFRSIIVVHPQRHRDPRNPDGPRLASFPDHLLWAHEFGHLAGLGHREGVGNRNDEIALMTRCNLSAQFSGLPDTRVQVSADECRHLLAGPGRRSPGPFQSQPVCRQ